MRPLRRWLLCALVALLAGVIAPQAAWAADLHHAGLVVRDSEGRTTYAWVPFEEDEISGIELLRRSGIPFVSVGFGALGEGVCAIGGEGCDVATCRRNVCQGSAADAPYWQFFRQDSDDPRGWAWLALGASATTVRDGDVFGWNWTAREPQLPLLPAAEIANLAGFREGQGSEPAVRTLLPEGVAAVTPPPPPPPATIAAAGAILAAIAVTGAGLVTWQRRQAAA